MRKQCKTRKNKVLASSLIGVGFLSIFIKSDATAFVMSLMMGLPLFFAKKNLIE